MMSRLFARSRLLFVALLLTFAWAGTGGAPSHAQNLPSWAEPSDGREAPERFEDPAAPQGTERPRARPGRERGQRPPVGAQRPGQRPEGPRTNVFDGCEEIPFFDACESFCDSFPQACQDFCQRYPNDPQCDIACEEGSEIACEATGVPLGGQWILVLVALGFGGLWLYNESGRQLYNSEVQALPI